MNSTTTEINTISVTSDIIEDDYFPPITLFFEENKCVRYKPVHVEKKINSI